MIEMTVADAYEILDEVEQSRDECRAEAGMGAVSMGFDPYAAMSEKSMTFTDTPEIVQARQVVAAHQAALAAAAPLVAPAVYDDGDDIPF